MKYALLGACLLAVSSCELTQPAAAESGTASVFCDRVTATGGMNCGALVAAHRTWALGSYHQVSHNGRTITVRIVDRGPAAWTHRVIDLSPGAARALGINGLGHVDMS